MDRFWAARSGVMPCLSPCLVIGCMIAGLVAIPASLQAQAPTAKQAARFLAQSTFGPNAALVAHVQAIGYEAFLDEQFNAAPSSYVDQPLYPTTRPTDCTGTCSRDNYTMYPLQVAFYRNALEGNDQLRQRVAFALSQIFVVSALEISQPSWMGPYLNILSRDAFGNYRTLLQDVTLSPAMGRYLDMAGNTRTNPNENYAREVLQLFSVGLDLLNPDGTPKLDANGNRIPTYPESTVQAFARVFTGWNLVPGATGVPDYKSTMIATNANAHDVTAKAVLNGVTLPANRTAAQDLAAGLDNIFNHPNVGPFIGRLLIQNLVTSNPSPAYVGRVAAAFNNNGVGVRGDLKAVVKAILLDPEARADNPPPSFGHLREPVLFITTLLRALNTTSATTDYVLGESYLGGDVRMGQDLFRSPSVFNYYPPGYELPSEGLIGPEFGILSTSTAMARLNFASQVIYKRMATNADRPKGTWVDLSALQSLASVPYRLTNELDNMMTFGSMSPELRAAINNAIASMPSTDLLARTRRAVYLIATSAEYSVQR